MTTSLSRRRFAGLLLSATPAALWAQSPQPAGSGRKLDFRVGDDFKADSGNVRAVVHSAAESIWKHCPNTQWEMPGFFLFHSTDAPITVFDHRADGRVAIGLTVQGNYWSQFAYQAAHEFCHALAGHSNDWKKQWIRGHKANHWLEESICETASLFAIRAMSESWKTAPPYPNWKSYAAEHAKYFAKTLEKDASGLPAGMTFRDWIRENEPVMREKSTLREKTWVVATQLLPVFEAEPAGWESLTVMNLAKRQPGKTLAAHFTDWSAVAPPAQHGFMAKLAAVFGLTV